MKPRKVVISIETETGLSLKEIKMWKGLSISPWTVNTVIVVDQIQVNVVKEAKSPTNRLAARKR
jgi:hypothetical protein